MPNLVLTDIGWQVRIREKLGVDEAYLPDSAIEQPDVISVAEATIIDMVPDYATLSGSQRVYLEALVVCECAVLLCPTMPTRLPVKEQGPAHSHELNVSWTTKESKLRIERDRYLAMLTPPVSIPWMSVAGPSR